MIRRMGRPCPFRAFLGTRGTDRTRRGKAPSDCASLRNQSKGRSPMFDLPEPLLPKVDLGRRIAPRRHGALPLPRRRGGRRQAQAAPLPRPRDRRAERPPLRHAGLRHRRAREGQIRLRGHREGQGRDDRRGADEAHPLRLPSAASRSARSTRASRWRGARRRRSSAGSTRRSCSA